MRGFQGSGFRVKDCGELGRAGVGPGGVSAMAAIPGTPLFLSASKDGEMKLWDAARCQQLHVWPKVHDKRTFLNARGFGQVIQVRVGRTWGSEDEGRNHMRITMFTFLGQWVHRLELRTWFQFRGGFSHVERRGP